MEEEVAQDIVVDQCREAGAEYATPGGNALEGIFAAGAAEGGGKQRRIQL